MMSSRAAGGTSDRNVISEYLCQKKSTFVIVTPRASSDLTAHQSLETALRRNASLHGCVGGRPTVGHSSLGTQQFDDRATAGSEAAGCAKLLSEMSGNIVNQRAGRCLETRIATHSLEQTA